MRIRFNDILCLSGLHWILSINLSNFSCENIKFITFNDKEENEIQIQIKNYKNETEYILHPGVSYMGHSLGYDYQIYLVE